VDLWFFVSWLFGHWPMVKKFVGSFDSGFGGVIPNNTIFMWGVSPSFCYCYAALASSTFCLETQPSGAGS
jgi:hypothetical protein